jgi:AcrR family transcriptional regulator
MVTYYLTMGQHARARSADAKDARRQAILAAATALFDRAGYGGVTMADIARRCRLAKGTVFLYFPTREAVFLDLLDGLLAEWLDELHATVSQDDAAWTADQFAGAITGTLGARPALRRLIPLCHGILERNVDEERLTAFKQRLLRRLFGTGAVLELKLSLARRGDGVRLLLFAWALIIGLGAQAEPAGALARVLARPEFEPLRPDFACDLRTALTILANGFHRKTP